MSKKDTNPNYPSYIMCILIRTQLNEHRTIFHQEASLLSDLPHNFSLIGSSSDLMALRGWTGKWRIVLVAIRRLNSWAHLSVLFSVVRASYLNPRPSLQCDGGVHSHRNTFCPKFVRWNYVNLHKLEPDVGNKFGKRPCLVRHYD